jgi:protein-S-isoprenylcysteine O-methyltransferase Ste14
MGDDVEDRPTVKIPPPVFFFACLGFGSALEYIVPSCPTGWLWLPRIVAGGILFLISGLLVIGAVMALCRNKTPFIHSKPTVRIVREGPFRFSRHPMYLSLLFLLSGVAVLVCSIWFVMAVPILFFILDIFAVKPEEAYLLRKFGDEYGNYRGSVRRWV